MGYDMRERLQTHDKHGHAHSKQILQRELGVEYCHGGSLCDRHIDGRQNNEQGFSKSYSEAEIGMTKIAKLREPFALVAMNYFALAFFRICRQIVMSDCTDFLKQHSRPDGTIHCLLM